MKDLKRSNIDKDNNWKRELVRVKNENMKVQESMDLMKIDYEKEMAGYRVRGINVIEFLGSMEQNLSHGTENAQK